jgi:putative ABC transport system permease protein
MRAIDLCSFSLVALSKHKLRTRLSLLGVAIGVMAVMLLTSLGEGARRYVGGQFEALGTNLLIVLPGKVETEGALPGVFGGAPNDLTLDDAVALERGVREASRVVPLAIGNETVSHGSRKRQVVVLGTTAAFLDVRKLALATGRDLPDIEHDRSMSVTVLGQGLARELFRDENPLGKVVRIGDWRMRVIGILEPRGTQLGFDMDELALVPVGSAMRMFNRSSLFRIIVELGSHTQMDSAKARTIEILTERHDEEDITCITPEAVSGTLGDILAALTFALGGIAAVSLTVAGIGIMNVMLVSVSERTAEVGLLRAMGARRTQIMAIFLTEAVALSSMGGLLGLAISWALSRLLTWWQPGFPARTPLWAAVSAIILSLVSGVVFGVLPALKASRLDPVTALSKR